MNNPFVKLHIAILLAGFTGILGKLILLPTGPLVWYRMLLTAALFACWLWYARKIPVIPWRETGKFAAVGALLAVHWMFFYGSIKYANVSIAVVCFALNGFFAAVFEPVWDGKRVSPREIGYSLISVLGIALIFHFDTQYRLGIILGVLSAAFAALYAVSVRRTGAGYPSSTLFLYQMLGGLALLTLCAPAYLLLFPGESLVPSGRDVLYLLLLASACTIGLFMLQIQVLREISAFTVSLSFNLEPIYSILLAMLLFGEASELGASFAAGLACIAVSVCLQSVYTLRQLGRPPVS